jgi:hypothetical protein
MVSSFTFAAVVETKHIAFREAGIRRDAIESDRGSDAESTLCLRSGLREDRKGRTIEFAIWRRALKTAKRLGSRRAHIRKRCRHKRLTLERHAGCR